ncbi:hypothetical protein J0A68_08225 [Algoriphagus sp. H41]|uniref:PH domain-containing protein n=1 Tax=Algoriphagus oliviformis TaxID=2811231 RepID=A0ABS3C1E3_9BACT|nr:hypothetical protein [Algoriphagus oliviformis]MBN7810937.1 hypothetical protein [Algoriphagus oliviformis]
MSFRINKEKSILKERLVFKANWEFILEIFFEIFIYLGSTIMTMAILLNPNNHINEIAQTIIILLNILLLTSWYFIYKLLVIEISDPNNDRVLFVNILKKNFPELKINDTGLYMLRSKGDTSLFSWGKSLIVIFDEKKILINLTNLGRYETKSPLHSISNYLKLMRIRSEFKKEQTAVNN